MFKTKMIYHDNDPELGDAIPYAINLQIVPFENGIPRGSDVTATSLRMAIGVLSHLLDSLQDQQVAGKFGVDPKQALPVFMVQAAAQEATVKIIADAAPQYGEWDKTLMGIDLN